MFKRSKIVSIITPTLLGGLLLLGAGCNSNPSPGNLNGNETTTTLTLPIINSISFGRSGGNIKPFSVSINNQGLISSDYESKCIKKGSSISLEDFKKVVAMTQKLNLPATPGEKPGILKIMNPDIGKRFISLSEPGKTDNFQETDQNKDDFDDTFNLLITLTTQKDCDLFGPASNISTTTTSTTKSENKIITLDNNNQTLNLKVGESFLLKLGSETFDWAIKLSNDKAVERIKNVMMVVGAQGLYKANQVGETDLLATGDPKCFKTKPQCAMASIQFKLHIVVTK